MERKALSLLCAALLCTACASRTGSTMLLPVLPAAQQGPAAAETSAPLTSSSSPAGVDPVVWAALTKELTRVQAATARQTAAAAGVSPLLDVRYRVDDFRITSRVDDVITCKWTYKNPGDYDQNGAVTMADLIVLAKHWHSTSAGPDWPAAQLADGNGNGEIELGDVTPVGVNFNRTMLGYVIAPEWDDYDRNGFRNQADLTPIFASGLADQSFSRYDGPPITTFNTDSDHVIYGAEPHPDRSVADDEPGPWIPLASVLTSEGTSPDSGGLKRFSHDMHVRNLPGHLNFDFSRIVVASYFVSPDAVFETPQSVGTHSDVRRIPSAPRATLGQVKSWTQHLAPVSSQAEVDALAAGPWDMIIVEPTATLKAYAGFDMARMVAQLQASPGTNLAHKIVLAALDVSHADELRSYWTAEWQAPYQDFPGGIPTEHPGTPDIFTQGPWSNPYAVRPGAPGWTDVLMSGPDSELQQLLAAGFDGICCTGVKAYADPYFEGQGGSAMTELLGQLSAAARALKPDFIILQADGADLLNAAAPFHRIQYPAHTGAYERLADLPMLLAGEDGVLADLTNADPAYLAVLDKWRLGQDGLAGTADDKLVLKPYG